MKYFVLISFLMIITTYTLAAPGNASAGESLFNQHRCTGCHSLQDSTHAMAGPGLKGVTKIRDRDWLHRWLKDPLKMKNDPIIQSFRKTYPVPMPETGFSDKQIDDIIAYLDQFK